METREKWSDVLKVLEKKKVNLESIASENIIQNEGKIFSDKQRLR